MAFTATCSCPLPAGIGGVKGSPQASAPRVSSELGVYALQALTEQDLASGYDAPNTRLSRELEIRARNVRTLAYTIQHTLQNIHSTRQHLSVQPGANACWALASEMDTILCALSDTHDTTDRHARLHEQ